MAELHTYFVEVRGQTTSFAFQFTEYGVDDVITKMAQLVRQCEVDMWPSPGPDHLTIDIRQHT